MRLKSADVVIKLMEDNDVFTINDLFKLMLKKGGCKSCLRKAMMIGLSLNVEEGIVTVRDPACVEKEIDAAAVRMLLFKKQFDEYSDYQCGIKG